MKLRSLLAAVSLVFLFALSAESQTPVEKWAAFDGSKVHYYDIGDKKSKKAIVLIHGWTCNADFWKVSFNGFPGRRVIAIDLIGHGKSDKPKANYSMEYFARSVEAVLKNAKIEKAVLVGHSMGTPVIRQFYRLYPGQTLGLVAVDGSFRPFGPKPQIEKFFEPLFADYTAQAPKFIDGLLGPTRADLKAGIKTAMLTTPDHVATSAMRGMMDEAIYAPDQIKVPVLVIASKSTNWPPDSEAFARSIAPDLEFQMWEGVSHFLMMEKPKEFNAAVNSFIEKKHLL